MSCVSSAGSWQSSHSYGEKVTNSRRNTGALSTNPWAPLSHAAGARFGRVTPPAVNPFGSPRSTPLIGSGAERPLEHLGVGSVETHRHAERTTRRRQPIRRLIASGPAVLEQQVEPAIRAAYEGRRRRRLRSGRSRSPPGDPSASYIVTDQNASTEGSSFSKRIA